MSKAYYFIIQILMIWNINFRRLTEIKNVEDYLSLKVPQHYQSLYVKLVYLIQHDNSFVHMF